MFETKLPAPTRRNCRRNRKRAVAALAAALLGATIQAGTLQAGTEHWVSAPGASFYYFIEGVGTMSRTDNLVLSMDAGLTTMTLTGQVTYSLTVAANSCKSAHIMQDDWYAEASVDPAYTGLTGVSLAASGFVQGSSDLDYAVGYSPAGLYWYAGIGDGPNGNTAEGGFGTSGTYVLNGATTNYNVTAVGPTPFVMSPGHNGIAALLQWPYPDLLLRPANGATFFTAGTHTLVVDYPVSITVLPVPEPGSALAIAAGLAVFARRRRRQI